MVVGRQCIQRLDVIRLPPVGSRETYVPVIFLGSTSDGPPICLAGSGKTTLWFVISQPLFLVTILMLITSSAITQHIMKLRDAGKAMLAYFYFDFGDEEKQSPRNAVTSLLIQLSEYSKPCCDIIYRFYSAHGKGTEQPSYDILIVHLKEMLAVTVQIPIFIVMDALDECPNSFGIPSQREVVLKLLKDLVRLHLPNLRICVTGRPEFDIRATLTPLATHQISLHDETGHRIYITNYVSSVVSRMMDWRDEDKELVVRVLSERADGM